MMCGHASHFYHRYHFSSSVMLLLVLLPFEASKVGLTATLKLSIRGRWRLKEFCTWQEIVSDLLNCSLLKNYRELFIG